MINEIDPTIIEWELSRNSLGEPELIFEDGLALAHLILNQIVLINGAWERSAEAEFAPTGVYCICSDTFGRGGSDAEEIPFFEIRRLYRMWRAHETWGPVRWCALRRRRRPLPALVKRMQEAGVWDAELEALPP